jgi:putative DNA-invertase from lambdoid prophage Rac
MENCAIWTRVSTDEQHPENQGIALRKWAKRMRLKVTAEYETSDSAWKGAAADFDAARSAMLAGVRRGTHNVVLVRDLSRLSRRGPEDMFRYLRMLAEAGADVRSDQEPWLNTADPFAREILIGVMATLAKYQSDQRSKNTKAGMERARAAGKHVGRPVGARDKKPRRTAGYTARWAGR